jgi:hypothetical protein
MRHDMIRNPSDQVTDQDINDFITNKVLQAKKSA